MSPRYDYSCFCLELTRKCKETCAHCRCGEAQELSMPEDILFEALTGVHGILELDVTDGEPFLEPGLIEKMVDTIIREKVVVFSCVVMTDGTILDDGGTRCILALNRLGEYCARQKKVRQTDSQKENSAYVTVSIADDCFHTNNPQQAQAFYSQTANEYVRIRIGSGSGPDRHSMEDLSWLTREGRAAINYPKEGRALGPVCRIDVEEKTGKNGRPLVRDAMEVTVSGDVLAAVGAAYEEKADRSIGNILKASPEELIEEWNGIHLLSHAESDLAASVLTEYGSGDDLPEDVKNNLTVVSALDMVYQQTGRTFRSAPYNLKRRIGQLLLAREWILDLPQIFRKKPQEEEIIRKIFEIAGESDNVVHSEKDVELYLANAVGQTDYGKSKKDLPFDSLLPSSVKEKLREMNFVRVRCERKRGWRRKDWTRRHKLFCFGLVITTITLLLYEAGPKNDSGLLMMVLLVDIVLVFASRFRKRQRQS